MPSSDQPKQNDPGDENDWLKRHKAQYPDRDLTPSRALLPGRIPRSNRFPTTAVSQTLFDAVEDLEQAYTRMLAAEGFDALNTAHANLIQCRKALYSYVRELEIETDKERTVVLRF